MGPRPRSVPSQTTLWPVKMRDQLLWSTEAGLDAPRPALPAFLLCGPKRCVLRRPLQDLQGGKEGGACPRSLLTKGLTDLADWPQNTQMCTWTPSRTDSWSPSVCPQALIQPCVHRPSALGQPLLLEGCRCLVWGSLGRSEPHVRWRADPMWEGRCRVCWGRGGTAPYTMQKDVPRKAYSSGYASCPPPPTQRADVLF